MRVCNKVDMSNSPSDTIIETLRPCGPTPLYKYVWRNAHVWVVGASTALVLEEHIGGTTHTMGYACMGTGAGELPQVIAQLIAESRLSCTHVKRIQRSTCGLSTVLLVWAAGFAAPHKRLPLTPVLAAEDLDGRKPNSNLSGFTDS